MSLFDKRVAVIGLGYVGLPLAVEFGRKYKTIGFDINGHRIPRRGKLQVFGVVHVITGARHMVVVTILYGPHGVA